MDLWAFVRIELELDEEEFGRLTYRMLDALIKRYERRIEHQEMLFGIVAANVANHGARYFKDEWVDFTRYMPSQRFARKAPQRKKTLQEMTPDEVQAQMRRVFGV